MLPSTGGFTAPLAVLFEPCFKVCEPTDIGLVDTLEAPSEALSLKTLRISGVAGRAIREGGGCRVATRWASDALSDAGDVEEVSQEEFERLLESDANGKMSLALDEDETRVSCEFGADSESLRLVDASSRSSRAGFAACGGRVDSSGVLGGSIPRGIEVKVSIRQCSWT